MGYSPHKSLQGFEPWTTCSVGRRAIHCATKTRKDLTTSERSKAHGAADAEADKISRTTTDSAHRLHAGSASVLYRH